MIKKFNLHIYFNMLNRYKVNCISIFTILLSVMLTVFNILNIFIDLSDFPYILCSLGLTLGLLSYEVINMFKYRPNFIERIDFKNLLYKGNV